MNRIEVCFSPGEYHLYQESFDLVVVLDVLRATSAICTAIEHGVKEIIPVATVEEARELQAKGYIAAAERGGQIVEGFDLGNSPYSYMDPQLKGKSVVLTTTNGTKAIDMARSKETVVVGALNNLNALCDWLIEQERDILVLGSGWKDKFNLEDTICGGAIADQCLASGKFYADEDSTVAAKFIFRSSRDNMFAFLKASSHRRRLRALNLNEDVKYCLTPNNCTAIPVLKNGSLVQLNHEHLSPS
ncbi:MAG: 2-phosphosulfolactate phosphatase [Flavobacteriales bacterium]|jgi:2-phosphosulfolactate phosphatase|nr:2-phosphosulfolactate phosphatase [Flavobacteriales bacterium]